MNGDELCTCGHIAEERRLDGKGVHECEVDGCDCCCLEADADEGAE